MGDISKEEQLRRFKRRLDDPKRQWKISDADYKERKFWDAYVEAYEEALSRCNTERASWFIIPADCKWFRNLAVARIVVDSLEGLGIRPRRPPWTWAPFKRSMRTPQKKPRATISEGARPRPASDSRIPSRTGRAGRGGGENGGRRPFLPITPVTPELPTVAPPAPSALSSRPASSSDDVHHAGSGAASGRAGGRGRSSGGRSCIEPCRPGLPGYYPNDDARSMQRVRPCAAASGRVRPPSPEAGRGTA
jgi:hypothetical protein